MITAIDTNVLLDILVPNEDFFEPSRRALEQAWVAGSLVVCDLVYAELCVHFAAQEECDAFLRETNIRVEPGFRVRTHGLDDEATLAAKPRDGCHALH